MATDALTQTCLDCKGQGTRWAIAGHCFTIDGELWHLPGECKAPECAGGRCCCTPCPTCKGTGRDRITGTGGR